MSAESWKDVVEARLEGLAPGLVVFDADYTLWAEDLGFLAWDHCMAAQSFRVEAIEPLAEELLGLGVMPRREPHADGRQLMELYKMGAVSAEALVSFMVTCFAGWTVEEVRALGRQLGESVLRGCLYEGLSEFLQGLRERDHRLVVVSATAEWLVEGAIEVLGLPMEAVYGMRARLDGDVVGTRSEVPSCHAEGKVERLRLVYGDEAIRAAFSDSYSDRFLLEAAEDLRVAINPSEELAKYASERDERWCVVRPLRDVKGRAVMRYPSSLWV
jgi:phosphoserine phosphatase